MPQGPVRRSCGPHPSAYRCARRTARNAEIGRQHDLGPTHVNRRTGKRIMALAPELLYNSILTSPRLIVVPVADCGSQKLTVNVCVGAPSSGMKRLLPKVAARCRSRADP